MKRRLVEWHVRAASYQGAGNLLSIACRLLSMASWCRKTLFCASLVAILPDCSSAKVSFATSLMLTSSPSLWTNAGAAPSGASDGALSMSLSAPLKD